MKSMDKKRDFIRLRAEGKSYSAICEELQISKGTCTKWSTELEAEISKLKKDSLEELFSAYSMAKEGRIRRLGSTIQRIDGALEEVDFLSIDPAKLLDLKLKYSAALKDEYSGTAAEMKDGKDSTVLNAYINLLERLQNGEVTEAQAKIELQIINDISRQQDLMDSDIWGIGNYSAPIPNEDEDNYDDEEEEEDPEGGS